MQKVKEAQQHLRDTSYPQLRQIKVKQHNGSTIILEGVVSSFHMKQMAQEAVRKIENIHIQNNLVVNEKDG